MLKCSNFRRVVFSSYKNNPLKYGSKRQFQRDICSIWTGRALDRSRPLLKQHYVYQKREYGMLIVRALRGVLKIRYLLIGGAVAGGGALQKVRNGSWQVKAMAEIFFLQKYGEWKDGLPDFKWLDEVLPDNDKWQQWRVNLVEFKDNIKGSIDLGL